MSTSSSAKSWVVAAVLAWGLPGLGHWYLGRRSKAAVFFVCIVGLFLVGWWFGQWRCVTYDDTLLFLGQSLNGAIGFAAGFIGRKLIESWGPMDPVPVRSETGVLYTLVAGFLNLLVVVDAFMVANNIERPTRKGAEAHD